MKTAIHRPLIYCLLISILLMLSQPVSSDENQEEWTAYQRKFAKLCKEKGLPELEPAIPQKREIVAADAGINDSCITCHMGIDNPAFEDAPQPFRTHPGEILGQHPMEQFGCTVCHHGSGKGLTRDTAHGRGTQYPIPLIPVKYAQSTCIGCHETPYGLKGAEKLEKGRLAFEKYACYACHKASGFENLAKFAPPQTNLEKKIKDTRWIISWLRNPKAMHAKTIMPDFKLSDDEIRDLTAFLLSLETEKEYPEIDLSAASATEGEKAFTELGCKACHSEKTEEGSFRRHVPNLADAGLKLKPGWSKVELDDPKSINPDARIPKLDITEQDALNIIAYLMTLKANSDIIEAENLKLDDASTENGKKLAELYGCYGCHSIEGFEEAKIPSIDVAETAKKKLEEISFGDASIERTKWDWIFSVTETPRIFGTGDSPARMPVYTFDEGDAEDLTTFYLSNYRFDVPDRYMEPATRIQQQGQAGEWLVTERNCRGCHMFEEEVTPRIESFIELKTYVPPRLVGEGEKVQPTWAAKYLDKPEPMRPWLNMRMPTFSLSEEQIQDVLKYFSVKAESPQNAAIPYEMPVRKEDIPQIEIDMGEYRLRFDKCMQCHPVSIEGGLPEDVKVEDLSINLMLSKERLRFEWIKNFLKNPDKYAGAGTKMPYIYYEPDGRPKVSDAEMWIDYVARYLMIMETVPEPLVQEEKAEEEEVDWTEMEY